MMCYFNEPGCALCANAPCPVYHALCTTCCAQYTMCYADTLHTACSVHHVPCTNALCTYATCTITVLCVSVHRVPCTNAPCIQLCASMHCAVCQMHCHLALSAPKHHTLHMLSALTYIRCTMHSSCEPMHCAQRSLHQNMHCAMHFVHQSTLLCSVHSAPTLSALMLCALKHRAQGSVHQSTMHCAASHAPTQQHPLTLRTAHALYESPPSALRMRPALSTRCAHINPSHCACALCIASLRTAHAQRIT